MTPLARDHAIRRWMIAADTRSYAAVSDAHMLTIRQAMAATEPAPYDRAMLAIAETVAALDEGEYWAGYANPARAFDE